MVLACVATLSGAALAQPGSGRMNRCGDNDGGRGSGPEMRIEMMKKHLELTDDQAAAIEEIREATQQQNAQLRKDMARLQNERQGEMLKDDPSERALVELIEKMGEVRTRLQVNRAKARLAVREQLNEEQRDKMMLHAGRGGHGRHGMNERRGRHQRHGQDL